MLEISEEQNKRLVGLQEMIDRHREDSEPFDNHNAYINGVEHAMTIFKSSRAPHMHSYNEGMMYALWFLLQDEYEDAKD